MYETRWKTERGGNSTEHVRRGAAHSNSEDSIGTGNHAKRKKKQTKKESPISRQRGRNGCVRDFADTERTKRNTKHIKEKTSSRPMLYRAGKVGIQTVDEDEIYRLGQYGDTNKAEGERRDGGLVRPRHRTTSVAVCVSRAQLHGLREGGGAQKRYEHFRRSLTRGRKLMERLVQGVSSWHV